MVLIMGVSVIIEFEEGMKEKYVLKDIKAKKEQKKKL